MKANIDLQCLKHTKNHICSDDKEERTTWKNEGNTEELLE